VTEKWINACLGLYVSPALVYVVLCCVVLCCVVLWVHRKLVTALNVSHKSCTENQNTHFVFSNCFSENPSCLWDKVENIVQRGRAQMAIWRMRITCCKYTASSCVTLSAFPPQQWFHERPTMLHYMYIVCRVKLMCCRAGEWCCWNVKKYVTVRVKRWHVLGLLLG
jgi:hypothetical protein